MEFAENCLKGLMTPTTFGGSQAISDLCCPPLVGFFVPVEVGMRQHLETLLLIGLGGFIGANLRYWVSGWAARYLGQVFPWGTLIINFSGSCLLAVFIAWSANRLDIDPRIRLFLAIGFFGAYTTFSTYANESIALSRTGDWVGMWGNILGTNLLCLAGAWIGLMIGKHL